MSLRGGSNSLMNSNLSKYVRSSLEDLEGKNLYRELRPLLWSQPGAGKWMEIEGKRFLNLCSNNYLGLSFHPRVMEAARQSLQLYGCGSGASRLICGDLSLNEKLEERLAALKGQESALLFNSGYNANLGVISGLAKPGDVVFSDELNHASIIDGCRLSRAAVQVFPHKDMRALETKLKAKSEAGTRRFIVTDAVFSMDGDLAPLPELVSLAERYDCTLIIDEAHATGTIGPGGKGLVAHYGLEKKPLVIMGTLSKALGCFGAFISGSEELRKYLINFSRSFIYTTALPPVVLASALEAVAVLEDEPRLVEKLQNNADYVREGLRKLGCRVSENPTPIIPLIAGKAERALRMADLLRQEGLMVTAVRPPTVPEGGSRIRLTVMANHTREELDFALEAFRKAGEKIGLDK